MQMSGEYGTELLIRYSQEQLLLDLERRRLMNERRAQTRSSRRDGGSAIRARFGALFGAHTEQSPRPSAAVSQVHAAHR